jgi:hypothetical protein
MTDVGWQVPILADLIDVMHLQTKKLETLIAHGEQTTDRLGYDSLGIAPEVRGT